jgi:hypothetical protein
MVARKGRRASPVLIRAAGVEIDPAHKLSCKLTEPQKAAIVRRYLAGETTTEIDPDFGISPRSVVDPLACRLRPGHRQTFLFKQSGQEGAGTPSGLPGRPRTAGSAVLQGGWEQMRIKVSSASRAGVLAFSTASRMRSGDLGP